MATGHCSGIFLRVRSRPYPGSDIHLYYSLLPRAIMERSALALPRFGHLHSVSSASLQRCSTDAVKITTSPPAARDNRFRGE
jgi:hypothetical protein